MTMLVDIPIAVNRHYFAVCIWSNLRVVPRFTALFGAVPIDDGNNLAF
jgi:hypothetical protein